MAETVHLYLKGKKSGDIKGESTQGSHGRQDSIECVAYQHGVETPRDQATGQPTGKRKYTPIKVVKRIDKASPLIISACATNESIDGTFKFFRPNPKGDGTTEQFFTVKITNGNIASVKQMLHDTLDAQFKHYAPLEEVTFTFQKIEWTYTNGGITAADDWQAGE
jgi:type VI secretion system secreted protein Hcp